MQRLGLDALDIVFVHDLSPDNPYLPSPWEEQFEIARKGAFPAGVLHLAEISRWRTTAGEPAAKTRNQPQGQAVRRARRAFYRAAQRIRLVAWQRPSDLASVLGEHQRHQLIDRCR